MKLLHLSDLHIGKTLNGFSLLEDQIYILDRVLAYVDEYMPQAVIIAGDVYDKPAPSPEAVRVFDRFLTALAEKTTALLISGNHDSPERIAFGGEIMRRQNVHLHGVFSGQMQFVDLQDELGTVRIHLLPFIKPARLRALFADFSGETYHEAVALALFGAALLEGQRNVLAAHQFVVAAGQEPMCCESEIGAVGGIGSVDAALFAPFDYVALGHLHAPQQIGSKWIRYAGSPLKYSFSECDHQKSAALVTLGAKGERALTLLPLTPLHDLRRLRGPLAMLTAPDVAAAGDPSDYIHVTLTDEQPPIDAIGKVRAVYPNVMALSFENAAACALLEAEDVAVGGERLCPTQLFEDFFRAQNGREMTEEHRAAVKRLLEGQAHSVPEQGGAAPL